MSDGTNISLYSTLFFSTFLLGWWSIWIPLSDRLQSARLATGEIAALVTNYVLIITLGLVLWALWDRISTDNHFKYGTLVQEPRYDDYLGGLDDIALFASSPPGCLAGDPFVGIWKVSETNQFYPGFSKINLWRNKTFEKYNADGAIVDQGRWQEPGWYGERIQFSTEKSVQFWTAVFLDSADAVVLELTPFRPDVWWAPYAHVAVKPARIVLVRTAVPFNSAPRELGERIVLPSDEL
ncbi:MAG: hypothetical protein NXH95_10220 [Pseudomonadaceae bacterium]|nr:hypothetical protein [Pseudomonadaceae bacterium]